MIRSKIENKAFIYTLNQNFHSLTKIDVSAENADARYSVFCKNLGSEEINLDTLAEFVDLASSFFEIEINKVHILVPQSQTTFSGHVDDNDLDSCQLFASPTTANDESPNFVALSDKTKLSAFVRKFNEIGLQISEFSEIHQLIESSFDPITRTDEKKVFLNIDMNDSTISVYEAGVWKLMVRLPIGVNRFINDLSVGLNVDLMRAQQVCFEMGLSLDHSTMQSDERLPDWRSTVSILAARAKDLVQLVGKQLIAFKGQLGGGIYVCGPGAAIPGLTDLFADLLKIKVEPISRLLVENNSESEVIFHANELRLRDPKSFFWASFIAAQASAANLRSRSRERNVSFFKAGVQLIGTWIKELS